MATKKYNPMGGLNWVWVNEQIEKDRINKLKRDVDLEAEVIDYVNEKYSDPKYASINNLDNQNNNGVNVIMCYKITDLLSDLETKFNFIKNHSDSKEDLDIAKFVVANTK